jgi:hypothetical protein
METATVSLCTCTPNTFGQNCQEHTPRVRTVVLSTYLEAPELAFMLDLADRTWLHYDGADMSDRSGLPNFEAALASLVKRRYIRVKRTDTGMRAKKGSGLGRDKSGLTCDVFPTERAKRILRKIEITGPLAIGFKGRSWNGSAWVKGGNGATLQVR